MKLRCARLLAWTLLAFGATACSRDLPADAPRVLVFTRTTEYRHENIEHGVDKLTEAGRERGIRIVHSEDPAQFNEEQLAEYRAVVFFNTTGDVLDSAQQVDFERYIGAGGGYVGIHSAADTEWRENEWPWYTRLVGAAFLSHPSTPSNVQPATIRIVDANDPATAHLPAAWQRADEYYDYQRVSPNITVLAEVDESTYEGGVSGPSHPISWKQEFRGGRSFYTGLGHTAESFDDAAFLQHVFGGLGWAMLPDGRSLDYAKAPPQPWRYMREVVAKSLFEPLAMAFTPGGELYVVARKGQLMRVDIEARSHELVDVLDVYSGDEAGLQGIAFDPGYADNQHVYLYYSTRETPTSRTLYELARYVLPPAGKLDRASKQVLLSIPHNEDVNHHQGGQIHFDAAGNLWLSTGDDTSPFQSHGYSPHDGRPGRRAFDARRSAANTQDLRGKILRIRPNAAGGYSVPAGNLFDDAALGRPEIYAMGLRNPFRFTYDDETATLVWGEVGPDAKDDHPGRGPRGYDEFNRTQRPGNFGWPFVIADGQPYRYWDFAGYDFDSEPLDSEPPSGGEAFDPAAPQNDSPHNTGARRLPPALPAWMAYPNALDDAWIEFSSRADGSGRTALAGPVFRAHTLARRGEASLPDFFEGKLFLYEFMRRWIYAVDLVDPKPLPDLIRVAQDEAFTAPIDMKIGPDGSLYVLEYGTAWFADNQDSAVSRIAYYAGDNPLPVAVAHAAPELGRAPLQVRFDGSASYDRNPGDTLAYAWSLAGPDGSTIAASDAASGTLTLPDNGNYALTLSVTDSGGGSSRDVIPLTVGNEPPRIDLRIDGSSLFYDDAAREVRYAVSVHDAEDGSTDDGSIPSDAVSIELEHAPDGFGDISGNTRSETLLRSLHPGEGAMRDAGCFSCHTEQERSAGPALLEIATRYEGNPEVSRPLAKKVIAGGSGVWGAAAMTAHPDLDEAAVIPMIEYILSLSGESPTEAGLALAGTLRLDQQEKFTRAVPIIGALNDSAYRLRVSYRDRGGDGVGPITRRETRVFRYGRQLAATATEQQRIMALVPPPTFAGLETPDEELAIGLRHGSALGFRATDLTGVDSIVAAVLAPSLFMKGGVLELRIGAADGDLAGSAEVETSLSFTPLELRFDVSALDGPTDLYFVFTNEEVKDKALFILTTVEFREAD